jgi:hypothetical protein
LDLAGFRQSAIDEKGARPKPRALGKSTHIYVMYTLFFPVIRVRKTRIRAA